MAKKTPALNTASMADISFLLLTFFLLTSSINTEEGIQRRLPPMLDVSQPPPPVKKRNVLNIKVNMYDQLLVNSVPMENIRDLKNRTKEFIRNVGNDPDMPEIVPKYISEFGETLPFSRGVISLQNDRGTSYKKYIEVQNQLAEAFNELRDEFSQKRFRKKFADLSQNDKDGVQKLIPLSISEAEPSDFTSRQNR
ncbi:MAG: biopolymer transporter ExbD [Lentimicrobiaceae bacterium]|nr:biopolymer transporter ExbD [Lentimicrobiaceae bacterium]